MTHFQIVVDQVQGSEFRRIIFFSNTRLDLNHISLWHRNKLMSLWHWSKLRSLWHWPKYRSLWRELRRVLTKWQNSSLFAKLWRLTSLARSNNYDDIRTFLRWSFVLCNFLWHRHRFELLRRVLTKWNEMTRCAFLRDVLSFHPSDEIIRKEKIGKGLQSVGKFSCISARIGDRRISWLTRH